MIYLTTGANGTGKTLNTLKWVRDKQVKEGRPVAYNGRFDMIEGGELASWKKIDVKDWQAEPDGTIFMFDEVHNDLPKRPSSGTVPEYVRMFGEHRKRGFDFFLITQHPSNLDVFVRKLIGAPGWHRHIKRSFGVDMVSVLEWSYVNEKCELPSAGKTGTVKLVPFPKEVYAWYTSATLHTAKKAIPKQVYILGILAIVIPVLAYTAFQVLKPKPLKTSAGVMATNAAGQPLGMGASPEKKPLTPEEYVASYLPRIPGMPQSASRYDEIGKPVQAPKPAACISGRRPGEKVDSCKCYSQQATPLDVPAELCRQFAAGGFFDDTLPMPGSQQPGVTSLPPSLPAPAQTVAATPSSPPVFVAGSGSGYGLRDISHLQARNAATKSTAADNKPISLQ